MANAKKHLAVLGLGSFGAALAERLCVNGCRVTGVDCDRTRVELLKDRLYEAVIADVTQRSAIERLSLESVDAVFLSLGEDLTPSLLAALHAKELGAKRIIVKGLNTEHEKLLKALGVERVVFPEIEIAQSLADRITWPNVLDFLPIDPEYSVVEITMPQSLVGLSLIEADLRRQYKIWVIAVKDALQGKFQMFPEPDLRFTPDQILVVIGKQQHLNEFRELP